MKLSIKPLIIVMIILGMGVLWGCDENQATSDAPSMGSTDGDVDADSDADVDWSNDADVYLETENPANEGDQYEDVGTNPFIYTASDPFSTFAADVDTASYDIFKRDIENGILPVPESVRLEEYINYFEYDYPIPDDAEVAPFTISLDAAPGVFNPDTRLLRVGVQAATREKPQTNLVFLIDTSGSMSGAVKLPLVQHLLTSTTGMLDANDTIAIVTYAGSTSVALEPTPASDIATINGVINNLDAAGSTAGAAGIDLAYQQAEAAFITGGINHVILCTDGDFNVGPTTTDDLLQLIQEKRETGVTLTVLGFGTGNLNDAMMETISNAGNGTYGVISSEADADGYVENEMLASILFIAKDVKLQVEFNPELVLAYRLLGYENRAVADDDFANDIVDGGEIGSGHQVTALYELVMTGGEIPMPDGAPAASEGETNSLEPEIAEGDVALVKIRYKNLGAATDDPAKEVQTSLPAASILTRLDSADTDLQWAAAIAAFAEILKASPFADATNLSEISTIVNQDWLDGDRLEFQTLYQTATELYGN